MNGFNERFELTGDLMCFVERLEMWFAANEVKTEKKVAYLLTAMDITVYRLIRNMCAPVQPSNKTYDEIKKILKEQFVNKTNAWRERKKFMEASQEEGETCRTYLNKLKALAVNCEYEADELKRNLINKFITGLKNKMFEIVCNKKVNEITIENCMELVEGKEEIEQNINFIKRNKTRAKQKLFGRECKACGKVGHKKEECWYKEFKCRKCAKTGHLARVCKEQRHYKRYDDKNHYIEEEEIASQEEDNNQSDPDELQLFNLTLNKINDTNFCFNNFSYYATELTINGCKIKFEIDTGSAISAIPLKIYNEYFKDMKIIPFNSTLKAYDGTIIKTRGYITVKTVINGESKQIKLIVIEKGCRPLIGRDVLGQIGFEFNINVIDEDVGKEFKNLFVEGLGKYKYEKIKLKIKDGIEPIFVKPRSVPFAYKEKIEKELCRLEENKIISKLDTARWGTPIVTVLKKDGMLRICGDYSVTINKILINMNHPLPRIDDIFKALQGGKTFTKLDLTQAYNQLEVDEETSKLLAWTTHKGTYAVNRLPFGCKPNSGIFQSIMEKTLVGCENVAVFIDDIVVTGMTKQKHIDNLKNVLRKLEKAGFTINKNKCEFFKKKINYLGFEIDENGLHKDENKVKAIVNMPIPKNNTEVRAFCGLINYYARFIPNVSTILKPIYMLENKEKVEWNQECQLAYEKIKKIITSDKILIHYDPRLEIVLSTDASAYGIGACIKHVVKGEEKPIAYASRVLSKAEINYSMIDKEALAIYFGVKKFEQYLMGREFSIKTDHKPLIAIFGSKKGIPSMSASRLQRWSIYLSSFQFKIKYIKGKENVEADALSRLAIENIECEEEDTNYLNFVENEFSKPIRSKDVAIEVSNDEDLIKVVKMIKEGWKENNEFKENKELRSYYHRRNELTLEKGIIMWGYRVVIPKKFREALLKEIHMSHTGIVKSKTLVRSFFWWPGIDKDIVEYVNACQVCKSNQIMPHKVAPMSWPTQKCPYERIHIDFCGPIKGKSYLIIIDAYSKWLDVMSTTSIDTDNVIKMLKSNFLNFGIPKALVSDNGRSFISKEFEKFCIEFGIKHITSPPFHPSSNGQAENSVKTFKKAIYKINEEKKIDVTEQIQKMLYMYRITPHCTTNKSPYEMMFNRKPKSRWDLLKPQKENTKDKIGLRSFKVGEKVYFRDFLNKKFVEGKISEVVSRSIYIIERANKKYKRHVDHIIKTGSTIESKEKINLRNNGLQSLEKILREKIKDNGSSDNIQVPQVMNAQEVEVNETQNQRTESERIAPFMGGEDGIRDERKSVRVIKKPNKLNL